MVISDLADLRRLDFNEEYGVRISEESRERKEFIANREKALA